MGGDSFIALAYGKTAEEAFKKAVEEAQYEHGHGGYTGTIAEKSEFKTIRLSKKYKDDPIGFAEEKNDNDQRVADKWGACGCTEIPLELAERLKKSGYLYGEEGKEGEKLFMFYGWASS